FGAWCAVGGAQRLSAVLRSRAILAVAIVYLLFAFAITLTWHFEALDHFVPRDWPGLKSPILRPAIVCGQHSLEIFCLGVFLAFAGQFIIAESSGGPLLQTAISLLGILIMIATAYLISWYKAVEGRTAPSRVRPPDADLAGGEA